MLSHDLARELLSRRNNDIRIEVLVDDDPAGLRDYLMRRTDLRDFEPSNGAQTVPAGEVVAYDAEDDVIVIRAGSIAVGGEPT
jgi:hypothetical protein